MNSGQQEMAEYITESIVNGLDNWILSKDCYTQQDREFIMQAVEGYLYANEDKRPDTRADEVEDRANDYD